MGDVVLGAKDIDESVSDKFTEWKDPFHAQNFARLVGKGGLVRKEMEVSKPVARERKNKKEIKAALLASVHHLGYIARSLGYIFL